MAFISFKSPDDVRYPIFPVPTDFGLVFPSKGETYTCAPEIQAALALGCEITIQSGFIIDYLEDTTPLFADFTALIREKRDHLEKGSLEELLTKEIGNSCYGKTAEGVSGKKTIFDPSVGYNKKVELGQIAHPVFAATITSFIRAVLGELLNALPAHANVISVTTDGFLTDMSLDELDISGPLCQKFLECLQLIRPNATGILEVKHQVKQLISIKTRGQLTTQLDDSIPSKPVTAKCGVHVPRSVVDHNEFMIDLFINRFPKQKIDNSHLISMSDMWITESDLIKVNKLTTLNLEPDFKRRPVSPGSINFRGHDLLTLESKPWYTVEEFQSYRMTADNWRLQGARVGSNDPKDQGNCFKTLTDFNTFHENALQIIAGKNSGINNSKNSAVDVMVRMFIRVYLKGEWGLERHLNQRQLAEWLESKGFDVTVDTVRNNSRKNIKITEHCVALVTSTINCVPVLLELSPNFEYWRIFAASRSEVDAMIP